MPSGCAQGKHADIVTIAQLANRMDGFVDYLQNGLLTDYAQAGLDLVAGIEERVTTEGKDAKQTPLKAYTDAYKKFKQNPQNTKRGKTLGLGSSRYTGKVDYNLTGEFWADMGLLAKSYTGSEIKVSVGLSKEVNIKKYKSLTKRDGQEPLEPSIDEVANAARNLEQRVKARI